MPLPIIAIRTIVQIVAALPQFKMGAAVLQAATRVMPVTTKARIMGDSSQTNPRNLRPLPILDSMAYLLTACNRTTLTDPRLDPQS
jgi:hypothetical protein